MADCGSDAVQTLNVILVGKSGNGKSSTGNTLLGESKFESKMGSKSVTKKCMQFSKYRPECKCEVNVVDTPGLFDTDQKLLAPMALEIQEALTICPSPSAFLLIMRVDVRLTDEERRTIDLLQIIFGEDVLNHTILVFTRGAEVGSDEDFDSFINEDEALVNLKHRCNDRIVRFENNKRTERSLREKMVNKLFHMIKEISDNGTTCYKIETNVLAMHTVSLMKNLNFHGTIQEQIAVLLNTIKTEYKHRKWATFVGVAGGVFVGGGAVFAFGPAGLAVPAIVSGAKAKAVASNVVAASKAIAGAGLTKGNLAKVATGLAVGVGAVFARDRGDSRPKNRMEDLTDSEGDSSDDTASSVAAKKVEEETTGMATETASSAVVNIRKDGATSASADIMPCTTFDDIKDGSISKKAIITYTPVDDALTQGTASYTTITSTFTSVNEDKDGTTQKSEDTTSSPTINEDKDGTIHMFADNISCDVEDQTTIKSVETTKIDGIHEGTDRLASSVISSESNDIVNEGTEEAEADRSFASLANADIFKEKAVEMASEATSSEISDVGIGVTSDIATCGSSMNSDEFSGGTTKHVLPFL